MSRNKKAVDNGHFEAQPIDVQISRTMWAANLVISEADVIDDDHDFADAQRWVKLAGRVQTEAEYQKMLTKMAAEEGDVAYRILGECQGFYDERPEREAIVAHLGSHGVELSFPKGASDGDA